MSRQYQNFAPLDADQVRARLSATVAVSAPDELGHVRETILPRPPATVGQCRFCEAWAPRYYHLRMQLRDPGPGAPERRREEAAHRWLLTAPLCDHHVGILLRAGERGRVHRNSRVRYWLEGVDHA